MKALEIVHVRLVGISPEDVSGQVSESLRQENAGEEVVCMYRREGLEMDLAIHIHRADTAGREHCALGLRLAAALKEHGAVKHTSWKRLG